MDLCINYFQFLNIGQEKKKKKTSQKNQVVELLAKNTLTLETKWG